MRLAGLRGGQDDFIEHQYLLAGVIVDNTPAHYRCIEHLHMQGFELGKEFAGGKRIERGTGQAIAQCLEQSRHQLQQAQARLVFSVRLHAPDQLIHGLQRFEPLAGGVAMLEAGQQHHLAPGFFEQAHHHPRQRAAKQTPVEFLLHPLTSQRGACAALLGVARALFQQLVAASLITAESEEFSEQFGENRRVVDKVAEQPLDDFFDPQVQAVALAIITGAPTHGCRGDLVEQAPGRVTAAAEEALVEYRHFEHRDLHAADQGAQRTRQVAVGENELEKHGDEVDDILVDHFDLAVGAAFYADPGQQLFKLLVQVEVVGLGCWRHVMLQVREQAQQVTGTDRLHLLARLQARGNTPAHRRKQGLQRGKHRLAVGIQRIIGRFVAGCAGRSLAFSLRAVLGAAPRHGLELGEHASGNQQLIGFAVQLVGVVQHIALEQLENDQLDLDPHAQAAPGTQKVIAEHRRAQRVARIVQGLAHQGAESQGQLVEGDAVAGQHPRDHGIQRHGAFQLVIGHQCQAVVAMAVQGRQ
ncbi:hypothetical protein D3C80_914860 [compost metagenome]